MASPALTMTYNVQPHHHRPTHCLLSGNLVCLFFALQVGFCEGSGFQLRTPDPKVHGPHGPRLLRRHADVEWRADAQLRTAPWPPIPSRFLRMLRVCARESH